jgi:hypothetical protein
LRASTHEAFPLRCQTAATVVIQVPETPRPSAQGVIDGVLREMPASFLCPLSKEVMTDPVLLVASGHTYDLPALAKHFAMQVRHDTREKL